MDRSCDIFEFMICSVVIGFLCLFGIAGNGSAIVVLTKHHSETATITILQVLALVDSLLLVTTLLLYTAPSIYPFTGTLYGLYRFWKLSRAYVWPIAMIAHTSTVWLTVMVTVTRYMSVCKPIGRTNNKCSQNVRIQVIVVIFCSVIFNIPRFFEHHSILFKSGDEYHKERLNDSLTRNTTDNLINTKAMNLGDSRLYQIIYSNILYFPVMFIFPLLSLTYMNLRLVQTISEIKKRRASMTGHRPRDDHITLCIIAIVCVFVICQTPAMVNQIFWAIRQPECGAFHFYYTKISDVLVVLNSSCNFIIYCLFGQSFRKIFMETICRKRTQNDKETTEDRYNIPLIEICEACKSDFQSDANTVSSKNKTCSCKTSVPLPEVTEQATVISRAATSMMNLKSHDNGHTQDGFEQNSSMTNGHSNNFLKPG